MSEDPITASAQHQVSLSIPADSAYVTLVRTATAGYAARLDLTLDVVEDLRLAVDEACALLLNQARPGSKLSCGFSTTPTHLTIDVTVESESPEPPAQSGFAWAVLTALAGDVYAGVDGGNVTLTLSRKHDETPDL